MNNMVSEKTANQVHEKIRRKTLRGGGERLNVSRQARFYLIFLGEISYSGLVGSLIAILSDLPPPFFVFVLLLAPFN